jgi:hypothetical protein
MSRRAMVRGAHQTRLCITNLTDSALVMLVVIDIEQEFGPDFELLM